MKWEDEGYLLSKKKFKENANIINVFTNSFGKVSGIVYGGNSRKIKNYLQISNKIFVIYNSKNENKVGYFKTELIEAISPRYFNDKKKTTTLLALTSILNSLLPEYQTHKNIYSTLTNLIKKFSNDDWIVYYIYWELNLIKELGFDTNLYKFNNREIKNNEIMNLKIDGTNYQIPSFLIKNTKITDLKKNHLKKALNFTRTMMLNKFFIPNNLNFPKSRILLENYF
tara:strand:+ start:384 stop:1061 length:678 start_codon:yes stop_codon:yes gene_type:complete